MNKISVVAIIKDSVELNPGSGKYVSLEKAGSSQGMESDEKVKNLMSNILNIVNGRIEVMDASELQRVTDNNGYEQSRAVSYK